ncbi:glucose-6-phosphatase 3 isoform X2 [Strigops habroptila]|uniref:Glucose-6-phosphatase 3 n=1 Tax=Strigops habroptila TaxID=2489341 RepID=A0A672UQM3_STRHB|nr:glucose-6-phosphatase 3 isoform X2 [Strigops habroptila]
MEGVHVAGLRFAALLQSGPPWLEPAWVALSSAADPRHLFTAAFPLCWWLGPAPGAALLWGALVAEWLNVVLKWLLFGERPFWWVHESGMAAREPLGLRQFPVTCETGPGSPSGHCMVTGAALWPLVSALSSLVSARSGSPVLRIIPFAAYILLMVAVGLSRVFVLAHFPHQVVAGILAGAVLGWGLQGRTPGSPRAFACAALVLPLSALILRWVLRAAGLDIDWSLRLAAQWCSSAAWLRRDSRPLASLWRDAGSALGLALAAASPAPRLGPWQRLAGAAAAVAAVQGLHRLREPQDATLWYGSSALRYAAGPWIVASLLPRLLAALGRVGGAPHRE